MKPIILTLILVTLSAPVCLGEWIDVIEPQNQETELKETESPKTFRTGPTLLEIWQEKDEEDTPRKPMPSLLEIWQEKKDIDHFMDRVIEELSDEEDVPVEPEVREHQLLLPWLRPNRIGGRERLKLLQQQHQKWTTPESTTKDMEEITRSLPKIMVLSTLFGLPAYLLILLLKGRLKERVKALSRDQLILAWACGLGPSLFWGSGTTTWYNRFASTSETVSNWHVFHSVSFCLALLFLIPITWQWMEAQKNKK